MNLLGLFFLSFVGEWQTGPFPPNNFQYARHDGAFVPGPEGEPWANKVYFLGGRTSPPTESPDIWMYDPLNGTYTDTGANVVEDVSNYNANLILDDGTGRGPAVYVIGGTNKDGGGVSIGLVQRYYPQTNQAEALSSEDNWNVRVGGSLVAAMGTAVVNDIIYAYGGWEANVPPYFSSQTFNPDPYGYIACDNRDRNGHSHKDTRSDGDRDSNRNDHRTSNRYAYTYCDGNTILREQCCYNELAH